MKLERVSSSPAPGSMKNPESPGSLTLLEARKPLTKRFTRSVDKERVTRTAYPRIFKFKPKVITLGGIEELSDFLTQLEGRAHFAIVRGALTRTALRGTWIRRLLHRKDKDKPTLQEAPRSWLCLDIDAADFPKDLDPTAPRDRETAIERVIEELPKAFHGVSYHYQWSSSMGIGGDWSKLKLHLWFWLTTPLIGAQLKRWLSDDSSLKIDESLFSAAQLHYTAAPTLQGIENPLGAYRSRLIRKDKDSVTSPEISIHPSGSSTNSPSSTSSSPKRRATKSTKGTDTTKPVIPFKSIAEQYRGQTTPRGRAILRAVELNLSLAIEGARHTLTITAGRYLGAFVREGIITPSDAHQSVLTGATLNGLLAEDGLPSITHAIEDSISFGVACCYAPPPPPGRFSIFASSTDHIEDPFARPGVTLDEAPSLIEKLITEATKEASRSQLHVLAIPCGTGKSHVAALEAIKEVSQGRTIVYLCRNHQLATELKLMVEMQCAAQGIDIPVKHMEGILRRCQVYRNADVSARALMREAIDTTGRRALCGQGKTLCPFAHSCPAFQEAQKRQGEAGLLIGVHAHAGHLDELPEDTIVIFDEAPNNLTYLKEITTDDLESLIPHSTATGDSIDPADRWRCRHQHTIAAAAQGLKKILQSQDTNQSLYTQTQSNEEFTQSLSPCSSALQRLAEQLKEDEKQAKTHRKLRAPINLSPKEIRAGKTSHKQEIRRPAPSIRAYNTLCALAMSFFEASNLTHFKLRQHKRSSWLEHHTPISLPQYPTIVLDATAETTQIQWEALAKCNDRKLTLKSLDIKAGHLTDARFIKTKTLRSSSLWTRSQGGEVIWKQRAAGALQKVASELHRATADLPDGAHISIGTHKPLADLIRFIIGEDTQDIALTTGVVSAIVTGRLPEVLSRFRVTVGHTGGDEVGSNRHEDCDALIILGTPRTDMSNALTQLSALSVQDDALSQGYEGQTQATLIQWLARARHLRRENVRIIYMGDIEPPLQTKALPSLNWYLHEIKKGPATTEKLDDAYLHIREALIKGEALAIKEITEKEKISEDSARTLLSDLMVEQPLWITPLPSTKQGGRPELLYSLNKQSPESMRSHGLPVNWGSAFLLEIAGGEGGGMHLETDSRLTLRGSRKGTQSLTQIAHLLMMRRVGEHERLAEAFPDVSLSRSCDVGSSGGLQLTLQSWPLALAGAQLFTPD